MTFERRHCTDCFDSLRIPSRQKLRTMIDPQKRLHMLSCWRPHCYVRDTLGFNSIVIGPGAQSRRGDDAVSVRDSLDGKTSPAILHDSGALDPVLEARYAVI